MASPFHPFCLSLLIITLIPLSATPAFGKGTQVGFYRSSCPRAETIVRSTVESHFYRNPTVAPGLLRIQFHDCFVQGCDASILISGPNTERTAPPNSLLRGFEAIDEAKAQLEDVCPGVVSCADIIALAARDAVVLTGGSSWSVRTGRRDGLVSSASDTARLPAFNDSVPVQIEKFEEKGLNVMDLVVLTGGHTIGTSACQFFRYRLYNFMGTGEADPSIDPTFLPQLRALCPPNGDGSRRVALDTGSVGRFDVSYFTNLRNGRGVLESDQRLWEDASTRGFVKRYASSVKLRFNKEFARAMVKMGDIEVKTGTCGEIRRVCTAFNS